MKFKTLSLSVEPTFLLLVALLVSGSLNGGVHALPLEADAFLKDSRVAVGRRGEAPAGLVGLPLVNSNLVPVKVPEQDDKQGEEAWPYRSQTHTHFQSTLQHLPLAVLPLAFQCVPLVTSIGAWANTCNALAPLFMHIAKPMPPIKLLGPGAEEV